MSNLIRECGCCMRKPRNIHEAFDSKGELDFEPAPASTPCPFLKGSWEQIDFLRERVDRGEDLYHVGDCVERIAECDRDGIAAKINENRDECKRLEKEEQKRLEAERRRTRLKKSGSLLRSKFKPK